MKRRIFAVLLMVLMLSAISLPVAAMAFDVQPYGAGAVAGGLTSAGGNGHYLWIEVTGDSSYKTGVSVLYKYNSGRWESITSVSTQGYSTYLYNSKYITLTSGSYKVVATVNTNIGSSSDTEYYNI